MEHPAKTRLRKLQSQYGQKTETDQLHLETELCRRAAAGGTEAIHWIWANYVPCPLQALAMPTSRNLAGAPSGVNNFGCSEYPNARRAHPDVPIPRLLS
jgi:hypothetical protein